MSISISLLGLLEATESHQRVAPGGFGSHARPKIVCHMELYMALQLRRKFRTTLRLVKETTEPLETRARCLPDLAHVDGSVSDRNFARMACACRQPRASRSNCLWPERVSL